MKEKLQWFEEALLEVRKVTKVTTGGRRMRFRAIVLIGDRAWHIGLWVGKGNDVSIAVTKATHDAYKNVRNVSITTAWSVPYMVTHKYKACYVTLRPAGAGTGLKAWSSVRTVLELSGYSNILSKIIGSNNKLNNAIATIQAITTFKVNVDNIQQVKDVVVEKVDDRKNDRRGGGRGPRRDDSKRTAAPRTDSRTRPNADVAPKAGATVETTTEVKAVAKTPVKSTAKVDVTTTDVKTTAKADAKPVVKDTPKTKAKPAPKKEEKTDTEASES